MLALEAFARAKELGIQSPEALGQMSAQDRGDLCHQPLEVQMYALILAVLCIATFFSARAAVSDFTGILSMVSVFFVVLPLALVNLVVTIVLAQKGRYTSNPFALRHAKLASVPAVLALVLAFAEFGNRLELGAMFIGILAIVLVFAWLPMLIHREAKRVEQSVPDQGDV